MLVITRKIEERLIIGEDIELTVLEIRGNRVKLGIRGPAEVAIRREELQASPLLVSPATSFERHFSETLTVEDEAEGSSLAMLGNRDDTTWTVGPC